MNLFTRPQKWKSRKNVIPQESFFCNQKKVLEVKKDSFRMTTVVGLHSRFSTQWHFIICGRCWWHRLFSQHLPVSLRHKFILYLLFIHLAF
ncbi:MAG: hypothetical protein ACRENG_13585, partial [bacterium]